MAMLNCFTYTSSWILFRAARSTKDVRYFYAKAYAYTPSQSFLSDFSVLIGRAGFTVSHVCPPPTS